MTRYTDEWLDAKLMNIQRWKREEAARSAAKQSTSGGVESRHAQGNSGERWVSHNEGCKGTSEPSPSAPSGDARVKNVRPCTGIAGVAPGPLTHQSPKADGGEVATPDRVDGPAGCAGRAGERAMTRYTDEWLDAKLMNIIAIEPRRQASARIAG